VRVWVQPRDVGGESSGGGGSIGHTAGSGGTGAAAGTGGLGTGNSSGTGSGSDVGLNGSAGPRGGQMNVGVMPLPPDILIVQDKSGSMSDDDSDLSYGRAIAPRHGTREQPICCSEPSSPPRSSSGDAVPSRGDAPKTVTSYRFFLPGEISSQHLSPS
jgi:hypothetical protein